MEKNLRDSGIDIIGNVLWGTHFCQFYRTKEDLIEILVPYFKAGLKNNELCIWITSGFLNVEGATETLKKAISDFSPYLRKGQVEIISYAEWYLENGVFNSERVLSHLIGKLDESITSGYDGLRLIEDTFWLRKEDWKDFINYEKEITRVTGSYRMIALCTYSLDIYNSTEVLDIAANHQFTLVKKEGGWEKIESSQCRPAEITLKRNEQHLNDTLTNVQDGIFELDREWRYTYINKYAAHHSGFEPEELIGECIWEKLPYMVGSKFEAMYNQVMETRLPAHFESKSLIRDKWYDVSVYPSASGIFVFWRDVTKRKRIEKALRESEMRFRSLFEVISSGVAICDVVDNGRDFIFKDINPAGERIDHVRRENIIGKSLYELFPKIGEMGLDAAFRRVWLTGKSEFFPLTYYKDENIALWVTNYIYRLPSGELVAVFEDITERKQAEEERERLLCAIQQEKDRLAALVNSITDEVWFTNVRENITLVNPPALSEFNISSVKAIDVRKLLEELEVSRPDGSLRPIEETPTLRALRGEVVKSEEEIVRTPAKGELRYRQVSAAPVRDTGGKIIGSVSVVRDITEHKKAEEALEKIEIARKKEIHHRIKNNLQVISSLLDLQAEKFINRECIKDSEVLDAFRESQDRVMSIALIHEELHEGRGDNALNFSIYLEKLVNNLFQTYRLGNTEISLDMDLEENLFFDIDTAVPLGMIVNELVSNSLKHAFSGRDKGVIQIKLSSEKAGNERNNKEQFTRKGNAYTFVVSDDGAGIPENIDLENPDTLGLQLVVILVDQLDGELELKRDKGTEFRIRINVQ